MVQQLVKAVIQAGRTAVCSYMRRRVEAGSSPDWDDVVVAMTDLFCCTASFQGSAVCCFFQCSNCLIILYHSELET